MPGRCFLALELPPATVDGIALCSRALLDGAPSWRSEKWVSPELYHVTVAFLGALPDSAMGEYIDAFARLADATPAIPLRFDCVRAVPGLRRASMVWAVARTDESALTSLRDEALRIVGAPSDARRCSAHVTLVRARTTRTLPYEAVARASSMLSALGKTADGRMSVPTLTLLSSTLGPTGPSYERLAEFPFGGGDTVVGD